MSPLYDPEALPLRDAVLPAYLPALPYLYVWPASRSSRDAYVIWNGDGPREEIGP